MFFFFGSVTQNGRKKTLLFCEMVVLYAWATGLFVGLRSQFAQNQLLFFFGEVVRRIALPVLLKISFVFFGEVVRRIALSVCSKSVLCFLAKLFVGLHFQFAQNQFFFSAKLFVGLHFQSAQNMFLYFAKL